MAAASKPPRGLGRVLNAAGTMTSLGASRIHPEAMAAAAAIAGEFVDMDRLQARASTAIARATGAQAGCMTACTAAGVTVCVAGCMTGDSVAKVEQLPDATGMPDQVVIQRGHMINYGAPIEQAIRLAGARLTVIGNATEVQAYHLEQALRAAPRLAAAVYVVSHHCVQEGMLPLREFAAICHKHKVPVIADMAAEYDLGAARLPGVAAAVYSSHKFLGGPTGGIIAGKRKLVQAAYLQNRGIGRTMKIGKESICGALAALELWLKRDHAKDQRAWDRILRRWRRGLGVLPGVEASILPDWTGNPTPRLQLLIDPKQAGLHAWELEQRLLAKEPRVFVRTQFIEQQRLVLEPCQLAPGEDEEVFARVKSALAAARRNKDGRRMSWAQYKRRQGADKGTWRP